MSQQSNSFNAGERAVLERAATGAPLPELLDDIVRFIEAQAEGMLCSIVLVDQDTGRIRHVAAPNLPAEYTRALDGSRIGPNEGSCGAAAYRKERIVVSDIATHPNWTQYRHLALPYGLRACWSSPIFSPQMEVLGTFAMYYHEAREPTEQEMRWVAVATHLASIIIMRDSAEQSLINSNARAQQLTRLYAVSSGVNEAIVRMREPQQLYDFACRLAVDQSLARLAWVGLCDTTQQGRICPVSRYGSDNSYVDAIQLCLEDERMNNGPAGIAVKTGQPALSNDIKNDPAFYWKDAAISRGLNSCAVFPLKIGERVIGVFALYAEQSQYFRSEEIKVLTALAADISFAVESATNERERRRMEAAVRSSKTILALIYKSVEDIIFYLAVDGPDQYRFLSVNPMFLKATGLSEADVVGHYLHEVIPESARTLILEKYRQAIAQREKVSWEEVTTYPSGIKHGEVTISPIFNEQGNCTSFVGTVHDVTARKQAEVERANLEMQLHQVQRMQSLGTLAGGIAHDFNNILAAISCNTDLALIESTASAPVRENLLEIQKASQRAIELVRQILTFSRREESKREVIDAQSVIEEALKLLRAALPQNVEIITRFANNLPRISADATQLHQVVMNLGVNAAQALGHRGGVIEVSLESYEANDQSTKLSVDLSEGRYLRLCISDNGSGMDELTLQHAFDPFFTTKPVGEGTGLGLSVVHGIVKSHNGAVEVQSELARGTAFKLYFPATDAAIKKPTTIDLINGNGERVMYVDDEEALTFLATRALTRLGYRVSGYSNAMAALQEFRAHPDEFDLVITDVSMPGLSGPELARELRLVRSDVPIIMTSGYIRPEDIAAAEQLGINQLVYKPNSIAELGQILVRQITALQA